jgi:hypothetical protein
MAQEYIEGDVVMYDNKIMVVKEPRDGSHFDLSCPKEGLTYCLVSVDDIEPVDLTSAILEKNGWRKEHIYFKNRRIPRIKLCTDEREYKWAVIINDDIMGGYIYYVHWLQHILYAFRIEEEMEV